MRAALLLTIAVGAVSLLAAPASATVDRADYAAQANPICRASNDRVKVLARRANREIKKLDALFEAGNGNYFRRLSKIIRRVNRQATPIYRAAWEQVAAIAAPPGDEDLVARWIANGWAQYALGKRLNRVTFKLLDMEGSRDQSMERLRPMYEKSARLADELQVLIDLDQDLGTQLGATECLSQDLPGASQEAAARALAG